MYLFLFRFSISLQTLIDIFSKQSNTFTPNQIKLMCIPLRPTSSKTVDIAVNKYKVWWFFLCKINRLTGDYPQKILKPFLEFCFGDLSLQPFSDSFDSVPCKM